jgi:hypothetical protein
VFDNIGNLPYSYTTVNIAGVDIENWPPGYWNSASNGLTFYDGGVDDGTKLHGRVGFVSSETGIGINHYWTQFIGSGSSDWGTNDLTALPATGGSTGNNYTNTYLALQPPNPTLTADSAYHSIPGFSIIQQIGSGLSYGGGSTSCTITNLVAGKLTITGSFLATGGSQGNRVIFEVFTNGVDTVWPVSFNETPGASLDTMCMGSATIPVTAGMVVEIKSYSQGPTATYSLAPTTFFLQ